MAPSRQAIWNRFSPKQRARGHVFSCCTSSDSRGICGTSRFFHSSLRHFHGHAPVFGNGHAASCEHAPFLSIKRSFASTKSHQPSDCCIPMKRPSRPYRHIPQDEFFKAGDTVLLGTREVNSAPWGFPGILPANLRDAASKTLANSVALHSARKSATRWSYNSSNVVVPSDTFRFQLESEASVIAPFGLFFGASVPLDLGILGWTGRPTCTLLPAWSAPAPSRARLPAGRPNLPRLRFLSEDGLKVRLLRCRDFT